MWEREGHPPTSMVGVLHTEHFLEQSQGACEADQGDQTQVECSLLPASHH